MNYTHNITMKIAIILVHYHTPDLLLTAVEAVKSDLESSGLKGEIIVIDNGSRPEDKELLNSLNVKLIDPGENLGYARGVNLGVQNTDADYFIFMNPDVEVLPGCIEALVKSLDNGASVAGPRFYMNRSKEILLPPLMELSRTNEIKWRLSVLGPSWGNWVRTSWRESAKIQWLAESPVVNYNLTGALLAIRRDAWIKVGPFDEKYQLYFEEADWLLRLKNKKLKSYYVPQAEAVHLYNQSAITEPKAKKWFEESSIRFRKRHYGYLFTSFLNHAVPMLARLPIFGGGNQSNNNNSLSLTGLPVIDLSACTDVRNTPIWIEVSESPLGIPAVAIPIHDPNLTLWRFPREIWDKLESKTYHFRTVDNEGNEISHFTCAHSQTI